MDVEETLSAVLNEKRRLGEELAQCTADKEFVWSLWKQLQSSSPDLTSAVSLIVTREKEKNERKDKRVLEILQGKDARILQLEEALLEKSDDLKRCRLQLENGSARLLDQTTIQKSQIENMEGQIEAARNELVQCREEHQSVVAGLETRLGTFTRENSALTAKLSATQAQAEETINLHLRRIESVKTEMLEKIEESNRKSRELQSVTNAKNRLEQDLLSKEDVHKRVESKHEETVAALKETLKLQLKQKSQELTRCKREIDDLKREVELCNGALDRERKTHKKVVREEREACARFEASVNEAQQRHVKEMTAKNHEVLLLQSRIRSLEKEEPETRDIATSPYRFSSPRVFGESSTLERIRLELAKTKQKLEARENELGELRSAQTRRLKRFKSLQNEHRLVLQQLKTYEQSEKGFKATNEWSPSPPRATAKELQQENSDSVWNELNYYRTQYASLLEEKVLADEECDSLRVKVAEQENIILDLQQCLEQERDELVSQLEKGESQSSKLPVESTNQKQLELTRNKAEALHESVLQLEEDKQRLIASRLEQQEECFRLREQVARLQTQLLREELHKDTKAVQCQPVVCSKGTDPACAELMRDDDTSLSWADVSVQVSLPQQRLRDLSSKAIQTDVGGGGGGGGESSSRLRSKSAGTPFAFGSHFNPIEAASKIPRLKSKHGEKVKQLELRIASLSRQLAVVQNEKDAYFRALEQQRQAHEELRAVHSACERREETLTEMRRDLESRQSEKTHLEEKLADVLAAQQQIAASLASSSASAARSESEWKQLEHRTKASSDESVRQGKLAKSLKADLQDQEARYKSLQEKVSRLERDVNRKQSLIDDLKAKLKVLREECETAAERVKVVENKLEAAGDMHEQRKARLQALKNRLAKEVDEKEKLQAERHHWREAASKKDEQCAQIRAKCHRTEAALARMTERTSESVRALESRYVNEVKGLEEKAKRSRRRLDEYRAFVCAYGRELLRRLRDARGRRVAPGPIVTGGDSESPPDEDASESDFREMGNWNRAKELSCTILNLSEGEFLDLMTASRRSRDHKEREEDVSKGDESWEIREREWWQDVERLSKAKPPFAVALVELFVLITEEHLKILTE